MRDLNSPYRMRRTNTKCGTCGEKPEGYVWMEYQGHQVPMLLPCGHCTDTGFVVKLSDAEIALALLMLEE